MERRAGVEPASTGFADPRVCRFATGAFATTENSQKPPTNNRAPLKQKTHHACWRVGRRDARFLLRNLAQRTRPLRAAMTAAQTIRGSEKMGQTKPLLVARADRPPPIVCRLMPKKNHVNADCATMEPRKSHGSGAWCVSDAADGRRAKVDLEDDLQGELRVDWLARSDSGIAEILPNR